VPRASSADALRRMKATRRRDTAAELAVRRLVHAAGLRFQVDRPILGMRRRPDLVFPRAKIAVFIDGCFWHSCPRHGTFPKANSDWWADKLRTNRRRDSATNRQLRRAGWSVLRFWEHEEPAEAAARIVKMVGSHRPSAPRAN
jgi:DNA mismatch endonuclease, patch repair protein